MVCTWTVPGRDGHSNLSDLLRKELGNLKTSEWRQRHWKDALLLEEEGNKEAQLRWSE